MEQDGGWGSRMWNGGGLPLPRRNHSPRLGAGRGSHSSWLHMPGIKVLSGSTGETRAGHGSNDTRLSLFSWRCSRFS